ncbi:MAG: ion transporter [Gammaproteobacteria bacterium SG8_11]|nr:MAG: ion transporter [Gammaproteobacteria bacterium SG8_11]
MTSSKLAVAPWRNRIIQFVEASKVEKFIVVLILLNAVTLGLETSATAMSAAGGLITALDQIILTIFVIEITLRIIGRGVQFFKDPWSIFDFTVVAIALIPAGSEYAVLRALRVLRVLRLLSMVPQMRRVVSALLAAIPGLSSIILVLILVFYVFAVMATNIFGADHPQWFGTIGHSMYTLFQIMTLESWSMGIVRPLMETHAYAWAFFVPFILVATFTMLNLFIAIIVNAMQSQTEQETEKTVAAVEHATQQVDIHLHRDIKNIEAEIRALRTLVEQRLGS